MSYIRKKTIDRPNADRHNSTLPPPPLLSVAFGVYTDQQAERHCRPAGRPDSDLPPVSTAAAGLTSSQWFSYHLTLPRHLPIPSIMRRFVCLCLFWCPKGRFVYRTREGCGIDGTYVCGATTVQQFKQLKWQKCRIYQQTSKPLQNARATK